METHLTRLRKGVQAWNDWRAANRDITPDLRGVDLSGANLRGINLAGADLRWTNFQEANLSGTNLRQANLRWADLSRADMQNADLSGADLYGADLVSANLQGADLSDVDLRGAKLYRSHILGGPQPVIYESVDLNGANLRQTVINREQLLEGYYAEADLWSAEVHARAFETAFQANTVQSLRLDVATPVLSRPIRNPVEVAVWVRPAEMATLSVPGLDQVLSEEFFTDWPAGQAYLDVSVEVSTPYGRVVGESVQQVRLYRDRPSPKLYFLLEIESGSVFLVRIFRASGLLIGTARANIQIDYAFSKKESATIPTETRTLPLHRLDGISAGVLRDVTESLLDCAPVDSDAELRAAFVDDRISEWRDTLPEANSRRGRVEGLVDHLVRRHHPDTHKNGLVLLMNVLADRLDPRDMCHQTLSDVAWTLSYAQEQGTAFRAVD